MIRKMGIKASLTLVTLLVALGGMQELASAADREKLLKEPGVYGTYAALRVDADWSKMDRAARTAGLNEMKAVVEKHREKIAIDTYLLRGLSDYADVLFRLHATDLIDNQNFVNDLLATGFGRHLTMGATFNGLTKKANYVPGLPDKMKADLKVPGDPGPKPYAIVIPIRKDAEWWAMDQDKRLDLMKEHTEATLPYLKTVNRKLYHSSGLDDFDFLTYFETAKLDDFNNLIIALEKVKENKHNRRFGHPTLIGTARSVDELVEIFAR